MRKDIMNKSKERLLKKIKANRLQKNVGQDMTREQREEFVSTLVRLDECSELTGFSSSYLQKLENKDEFPKRINVSANRMGWDRDEINAWIATRDEANLKNIKIEKEKEAKIDEKKPTLTIRDLKGARKIEIFNAAA